jgi:hypothetical protein
MWRVQKKPPLGERGLVDSGTGLSHRIRYWRGQEDRKATGCCRCSVAWPSTLSGSGLSRLFFA